MSEPWPCVALDNLVTQSRDAVKVESGRQYRLLGVRWYGDGPFHRETVTRETSKATTLYRVETGQFIYNQLFAGKGAFGLILPEFSDAFVSNEFPLFDIDAERLSVEYLNLYFQQRSVWEYIEATSTGTTASRNRWKVSLFLAHHIPLPRLSAQKRIVEVIGAVDNQVAALSAEAAALEQALDGWLATVFSAADRFVPLEACAEVKLGKMLSKESAAGPNQAPYVRNADIQWQGLNLVDLKTMAFTEKDRQRYSLRAGDILSCEGGDPGRSVILSEDLDGIYYQKAVHRVRATGMDPRFLYVAIKHAYASGAIAALCTVTTIKHLTAEKYRTVRMPLLTAEQQMRAVTVHDAFFNHIGMIVAEVDRLNGMRAGLLSRLLDRTIDIEISTVELEI